MSTTTDNLGLIKPELTDSADITAYNENWDKLDVLGGFGLGNVFDSELGIDDCNNAVKNGWYKVNRDTLNRPENCNDEGVLFVCSSDDMTVHQTFYPKDLAIGSIYFEGCPVHRKKNGGSGTWNEWEWENPPMNSDNEYRTTRRMEGESVYLRSNGETIEYRRGYDTVWRPYAHLFGGLPLDGSEKMTGSLKIKDYGEVDGNSTLTYLKAKKDVNNFRYLRIINPLLSDYTVDKCIQWGNVVNGTEKTYNLFGEHNKTSGSYTGNGSASARTIKTGANGSVCFVTGNGEGGHLLCADGAIRIKGGSVSGLVSNKAKASNGDIILTSDTDLNANGKTYYYQWL